MSVIWFGTGRSSRDSLYLSYERITEQTEWLYRRGKRQLTCLDRLSLFESRSYLERNRKRHIIKKSNKKNSKEYIFLFIRITFRELTLTLDFSPTLLALTLLIATLLRINIIFLFN